MKSAKIRPVRRIITGHDAQGRSTIIADAASPHAMTLAGVETFGVTDLWKTASAPADNSAGRSGTGADADTGAADPCSSAIALAPPPSGTVLRLVEFPPDKDYVGQWKRDEAFASMGKSGAHAIDASAGRHQRDAVHRAHGRSRLLPYLGRSAPRAGLVRTSPESTGLREDLSRRCPNARRCLLRAC